MTGTATGRPGLLSGDHIALIASGVSTIVASRDAMHRPSLMRAVGATITPDGNRITIYLNRSSSARLLHDLQTTGQIAVVFSEPYSHRTVQVKATQVQQRPVQDSDTALLDRYLQAMEGQLQRIGIAPHCTRVMLARLPGQLVAVEFTPEQAYDQTPGPQAGARLHAQGPAT